MSTALCPGTFELVGWNAYLSTTWGSDYLPWYVYRYRQTLESCSDFCTATSACIGLSFFWSASYSNVCRMYLSKSQYISGWSSSSGRVGLNATQLRAGRVQSTSYGLVSYKRIVPYKATPSPVAGELKGWTRLGSDAYCSKTAGRSYWPTYQFRRPLTLTACLTQCISQSQCIGFTSMTKNSQYCYLFFSEAVSTVSGWAAGGSYGGLLPSQLKLGTKMDKKFGLVSYARKGYRPPKITTAPAMGMLFWLNNVGPNDYVLFVDRWIFSDRQERLLQQGYR